MTMNLTTVGSTNVLTLPTSTSISLPVYTCGAINTCTTIAQPERKMTEPNSYAALSFLLYVVGIAILLVMAYTAIDWLKDQWKELQYDRKREIERLQDRIKDLERKVPVA